MDVIVAVLNGGRSQRMGQDKASSMLHDRPLWEWVRRASANHPTLFVGGDLPGTTTIGDAPGHGPLAGLAAALAVGAHGVLLVAVDQPWLRPATVDALIQRFTGSTPVVPVDQGTRQVTCAVYPANLATTAARFALDGRALQALLDDVAVDEIGEEQWRGWGEDGRSWFGTDTPEALATGLRRYGPPGDPP